MIPACSRRDLGVTSQEIASVGVRENFTASHYANGRRAAAGQRVEKTAPELRAADVAMVRALP